MKAGDRVRVLRCGRFTDRVGTLTLVGRYEAWVKISEHIELRVPLSNLEPVRHG